MPGNISPTFQKGRNKLPALKLIEPLTILTMFVKLFVLNNPVDNFTMTADAKSGPVFVSVKFTVTMSPSETSVWSMLPVSSKSASIGSKFSGDTTTNPSSSSVMVQQVPLLGVESGSGLSEDLIWAYTSMGTDPVKLKSRTSKVMLSPGNNRSWMVHSPVKLEYRKLWLLEVKAKPSGMGKSTETSDTLPAPLLVTVTSKS